MTDLSHDLRISREALAAAERRADEAERAVAAMREALEAAAFRLDPGPRLTCLRCGQDVGEHSAALCEVAAALSTPIGSGWLSPEQGAEKVKATIERCAVLAEEYDGPEVDSQGWDVQLGDANATKHAIARDIRALAAHPTEEA